jgi:hypothetical protein
MEGTDATVWSDRASRDEIAHPETRSNMPEHDRGTDVTPIEPRRLTSFWKGRVTRFTPLLLAAALTVFGIQALAKATTQPGATPNAGPTPNATTTEPDSVTWNPGPVTYYQDKGSCYTTQDASVDAPTIEVADALAWTLNQESVRSHDFYPADPDVANVALTYIHQDGMHLDLELDSFLTAQACARDSAAPGSQNVNLSARVDLGTRSVANLSRSGQVLLAAAPRPWFDAAVKAAVAAVAYTALVAVAGAAIAATVGVGTLAAAVTTCVAGGASGLLVDSLIFPDKVATTRLQIISAVKGCMVSVGIAPAIRDLLTPQVAAGVRRRLASNDQILGTAGIDAAAEAKVDLDGLATMVDGVAQGALDASS